ncbi:MAG: hypothetical protein ABJE63_02485 [Lentilitoribacter sp.]
MDYISTILARSPKIEDDERYRRILSYIEECNLHSCLAIALLYIGYEPKDHAKNIFIADHLLSDEEKNELTELLEAAAFNKATPKPETKH